MGGREGGWEKGREGGWEGREGKKGIVMEKKNRCRGDKYKKKTSHI